LIQSSFDDFTAKPAVAEFARSQIALKKHAEAYETELSTKRPADRVHIGVQAVFEKRINKHLKPVLIAAWFLDPCHAVAGIRGYKLPVVEDSEDRDAVTHYLERKSDPKDWEAVKRELRELRNFPLNFPSELL
jgi:hypothetical protein